MAIDPQALLALELPDLEFSWSERDAMHYALATGFGQDPLDEHELPFLIGGPSLRVSPSFAVTLYYDDRWMHASGVNLAMSLHGEQRNLFHRAIPSSGRVRVSSRIVGIFDKGPGRGLIVECEQVLRDCRTGEPVATNLISNFARADGGLGFSTGPASKPPALPARPPDHVVERPTRPEQALLYRLCGDRNPLHADPATARAAGFPQPILHGMCTYGFATRAILEAACDYDPTRLKSLGARISAPVFPGDLLRTEIWTEGDQVSFRTTVPARGNVVVLNNGIAGIR